MRKMIRNLCQKYRLRRQYGKRNASPFLVLGSSSHSYETSIMRYSYQTTSNMLVQVFSLSPHTPFLSNPNHQQPSFDGPNTYDISSPTLSTLQTWPQNKPCPNSLTWSLRCLTCHKSRTLMDENSVFPKMSMKGKIMNRSTIASEASHPPLNLSQISSFSMTSQQRKLHERGLYFPEEILCETSVQLSKGDQLWTDPFTIQLTTQSFGQIPLSLITKIKLYHGNEEGIVTLKIMLKKEIFMYKLERKEAFEVFTKVVWGRLATMSLFSQLEDQGKTEVDGTVYKRSEYLKCWEVRSLKVSKEGLKVFKSGKEEMWLRIEKTPELWTRFDTIKQERFLVVKLWRGTTKEEIGLPIEQATKWLQALCHLLG